MEHLKQQRWYQVMVYSFNSSFHRVIVLFIGSFLLFGSIQFLNATQTEMDCTERSKLDCMLKKQDAPCPKSTVPPCTREAGK
jgi:hypothetical protein